MGISRARLREHDWAISFGERHSYLWSIKLNSFQHFWTTKWNYGLVREHKDNGKCCDLGGYWVKSNSAPDGLIEFSCFLHFNNFNCYWKSTSFVWQTDEELLTFSMTLNDVLLSDTTTTSPFPFIGKISHLYNFRGAIPCLSGPTGGKN